MRTKTAFSIILLALSIIPAHSYAEPDFHEGEEGGYVPSYRTQKERGGGAGVREGGGGLGPSTEYGAGFINDNPWLPYAGFNYKTEREYHQARYRVYIPNFQSFHIAGRYHSYTVGDDPGWHEISFIFYDRRKYIPQYKYGIVLCLKTQMISALTWKSTLYLDFFEATWKKGYHTVKWARRVNRTFSGIGWVARENAKKWSYVIDAWITEDNKRLGIRFTNYWRTEKGFDNNQTGDDDQFTEFFFQLKDSNHVPHDYQYFNNLVVMRYLVERPKLKADMYGCAITKAEDVAFQNAKQVGVSPPTIFEPKSSAWWSPANWFWGSIMGFYRWFTRLGTMFGQFMREVFDRFADVLREILTSAVLSGWNTFIAFIDRVFDWLGYPNLRMILQTWISNMYIWMVTSVNYLISLMTSVFDFMNVFMTRWLGLIQTILGQWQYMIVIFLNFIDGAYTSGINFWVDMGGPTWVMLFATLYPFYLLHLYESEGQDAVLGQFTFIMNVVSFMVHLFIGIAQLVINIVSTLIESIPVVE